jgi:hypothetical protein
MKVRSKIKPVNRDRKKALWSLNNKKVIVIQARLAQTAKILEANICEPIVVIKRTIAKIQESAAW